MRAGKPISTVAAELGISQVCLHNWVRQNCVGHGEIEGISTKELADLTRTNERISELEMEVEILKRASNFLGEDMPVVPPKSGRVSYAASRSGAAVS